MSAIGTAAAFLTWACLLAVLTYEWRRAVIRTENVCIWWCEHCGRALEMRSGAPIHIESSTRGCLPERFAEHQAQTVARAARLRGGPHLRRDAVVNDEWLKPGAEVVVLAGRNDVPSPVLTIERVLKRDIVLSNGDRWSRKDLVHPGTHLRKRGGDTWSPGSTLHPAGSPQVVKARRDETQRRGQSKAVNVAHDLMDALRRGEWAKARADLERLDSIVARLIGGAA